MNVLLDTNVLARMAQPGHPQHALAVAGTDNLHQRGEQLCLIPQVLYEFWVVATRPTADNGLGFSIAEATAELVRLKALFALLPDTATIYSEWECLVTAHQVAGKDAHDARLVAAMNVHGLTHILTFNSADFNRYPNITVLDPATIVAPPSP